MENIGIVYYYVEDFIEWFFEAYIPFLFDGRIFALGFIFAIIYFSCLGIRSKENIYNKIFGWIGIIIMAILIFGKSSEGYTADLKVLFVITVIVVFKDFFLNQIIKAWNIIRSIYYFITVDLYRFVLGVIGWLVGIVVTLWNYGYDGYVATHNGIVFLLNKYYVKEKENNSDREANNKTHNKKNYHRKRNTNNSRRSNSSSRHRTKSRSSRKRDYTKEDDLRAEARKAQEEARKAKEEARKAQEQARRAEAQAQRNYSQQSKNSPPPDNRSAYEILGAQPTATAIEIKRAYKECCQRYHPDKYATRPKHIQDAMEEELKKVQQAYNKIG